MALASQPTPEPTVASEIERYLRTGDSDMLGSAWPGDSILARAGRAHDDLIGALVDEVLRRAAARPLPTFVPDNDTVALTRRTVEPMVRGLFPRAEQDTVLSLVERSVVFLTAETIETVLRASHWPSSAWDIANLYLGSLRAELLGEDAPAIVGLSEETTCYVSFRYFEEDDPFADFVVHEVAHIFHNCKSGTAGLPQTRRREWLLDIEYRKRETFAYACEAYACVLHRAPRLRDRPPLAEEFAERFRTSDARVDSEEVADIVREASTRRNGWKTILARCAPSRPARRRDQAGTKSCRRQLSPQAIEPRGEQDE